MLRRDRPLRPYGPGATSDRGQARPGLGEGVPAGRILTEEGLDRDTITGTPQGGILSPLLANIALSVLDEHFTASGKRSARNGHAPSTAARAARSYDSSATRTTSWSWSPAPATTPKRSGTRSATVLAPMGLRLSEEKTRVCHIDEGFDFLGWRIQRRAWRGRGGKTGGLHLPVEEVARVGHGQGADADPPRASIERSPTCCAGSTRCCGAGVTTSATACRRGPSATSTTSPSGGSSAGCANDTRAELEEPAPSLPSRLGDPRRRGTEMFRPRAVAIVRYRYRGTRIPTPWTSRTQDHPTSGMNTWRAGCGESVHVRFGGRAGETDRRKAGTALRPDPYTEHPTREGRLYCAVVLDAFSHRVVGWSIGHNQTAALTSNALGMAIEQRDAIRGTVIHSDHGTQITAWSFSDRAKKSGLLPSMGSLVIVTTTR